MDTAIAADAATRWCDMTPALISECLGISGARARALKKNPGALTMGQISLLARMMGKGEALLLKELLWCDAPSLANALDI